MPVKSVPITLDDGKTYHLRFATPNLCLLEREFAIPLQGLGEKLKEGNVGLNMNLQLLWAGLQRVDKEGEFREDNLTLNKVKSLVNPAKLAEVMGAVSTALMEALNPTADIEKNVTRPKKAESGTGKNT